MANDNPIGIEEMQRIFSGGEVDLNSGDIAVRIGQTKEIDETTINRMMSELNSLKEQKNQYASEREEIEKILAETNSSALYSGDTAQAARRRVQEVQQDLEKLTASIDELSDLVAVVADYNEKIRKIKAGQKYQLLCAVADRINREAEANATTYAIKDQTKYELWTRRSAGVPRGGFSENGDNVTGTLAIVTKYSDAELEQMFGKKIDTDWGYGYEKAIYQVVYINYWGALNWGKGSGPGFWFWTWGDDNTSELEQKIKKAESLLGMTLMPY